MTDTAAGAGAAKRDGRKGPGRLFVSLRIAEVLLCALATGVAALLYGSFFATAAYLPAVTVASAGGAAVATLAAARGWRAWQAALAAAGGFVLLAVFGVFTDTLRYGLPTLETAEELGLGLVRGWVRMLTVGLPADVTGELLVTPVLVSWAASFAATMLALRTRSVMAPAGPLVVAFGAGLLAAASEPGHHVGLTAAFVLVMLLLALLRANRADSPRFGASAPEGAQDGDGRRLHHRASGARILRGLPLVAVLALVGAAGASATPLASGEERFDPRTLRAPRLNLDDAVSPLAGLKGQLREEPARRLFTVKVSGPAAAQTDRIRVAALDSFDGVLWSSTDRYLVAGRQLTQDPALAEPQLVTMRVKVAGLPGPFLPAAGWPVRLRQDTDRRDEVWFSEQSGTVLTDTAAIRGFGYQTVGAIRPRDDGLDRAQASVTAVRSGATALPAGLPPQVERLARWITEQATSPYAKAQAIERHLRGLPYSLDARPGHTYGTLATMLAPAGPRDAEGYAEQRAGAFAVLARAVGIPARVAVGYVLRDGQDGNYTVTTRDAHAWPEVSFAGYGWVPFEPTGTELLPVHPRHEPNSPLAPAPGATQGAGTGPGTAPGQGAVPGPDQATPEPGDLAPPDDDAQPDADSSAGGGQAGMDRRTLLLVAGTGTAAVVGLLMLAGFLTLAAKAVRRQRRQRAAGNGPRVVGAWREATDRLVEHGFAVPPALTAEEVAERAVATVGSRAGAVSELAPLATAAVYSPAAPGEEAVERAWAAEARLRQELRTGRGPVRRLKARLDPRPLVADRRATRAARHFAEPIRRGG